MQFTVASVDELTSTSPVRRLFVVSTWKEVDDTTEYSKIAAIVQVKYQYHNLLLSKFIWIKTCKTVLKSMHMHMTGL